MVGSAGIKTARRQMPVMDPDKRAQIFGRMHDIRAEITEKYQNNTFIVSLARSLITGTVEDFFTTLGRHTLAKSELSSHGQKEKRKKEALIKLLRDFYDEFKHELAIRGGISNVSVSEYEDLRDKCVAKYQHYLVDETPHTLEVILSAIKILPEVASGKVRSNAFASTMAWIGSDATIAKDPGRIVLVLSGGSAKGVFYNGFLQAIQEAGLWPDMVVGTSAGAIAAAALGTGKGHEELKKIFSRRNLINVFHPLLAIITPILTLGKGVIGTGLGKLLRHVLGNRQMSDIADVFVISSALWPRFGKVVFGSSSSINGSFSLSTDVPAWKAVLSSASMPGLIPHVKLDGPVRLERLTRTNHEPTVDGANFGFVTLNDGGIDENLGILTADHIIRTLGGNALVIAVNLGNYNPQSIDLAPHISFLERIRKERHNLGNYIPRYRLYPTVLYLALAGWIRQEREHILNNLSPVRAFKAYEETAYHNVAQSLSLVSGEGMSILLNPNANGSLGNMKLTSFAGSDVVESYGYELGSELVSILLGAQRS